MNRKSTCSFINRSILSFIIPSFLSTFFWFLIFNRKVAYYSCYSFYIIHFLILGCLIILIFDSGISFLCFSRSNNYCSSLSDCMIGSVFYFTTGLHGFHVLLGPFLSFIILYFLILRMDSIHFMEFSYPLFPSCYHWHFVDGIWLYVLIILIL